MDLILQALKDKYTAQKSKALAELAVLVQNPVGLADHSSIIEEADQKIQELSNANENLLTLNQIIAENSPQYPQKE